MKINIPAKFDVTADQIAALKKEGQRIETEVGNRRTDFEAAGCSGYAFNGTMEVTSALLKANKPVEFEEVKTSKPAAKKEVETVKQEGPKAPEAAPAKKAGKK